MAQEIKFYKAQVLDLISQLKNKEAELSSCYDVIERVKKELVQFKTSEVKHRIIQEQLEKANCNLKDKLHLAIKTLRNCEAEKDLIFKERESLTNVVKSLKSDESSKKSCAEFEKTEMAIEDEIKKLRQEMESQKERINSLEKVSNSKCKTPAIKISHESSTPILNMPMQSADEKLLIGAQRRSQSVDIGLMNRDLSKPGHSRTVDRYGVKKSKAVAKENITRSASRVQRLTPASYSVLRPRSVQHSATRISYWHKRRLQYSPVELNANSSPDQKE